MDIILVSGASARARTVSLDWRHGAAITLAVVVTLVMFTLLFNSVHFFMGFLPGIKAFTAAVLGGIGNIIGAALGGLILGVLEQVGPNLFLTGYGIPSPNQLQDVIAFTVLVLVLIFRPEGLLGRKENV